MVAFPDLHRESTLEMPVVGAISAIAGGLLLPVSWIVGAIILTPCAIWLSHAVWLGIVNHRLRYQWSRQYPRRINWREVRTAFVKEPGRFLVHIHYYGGFDVTPLRPASVVEDRTTGELIAVHPPSWSVPRVCEQLGVELIRE
jgi:hypothetical protein